MALIASCWLLVESFVVPHGFVKWFFLSFYIHPFFLVFCQLFLWLKELICFFFYPLKIALRLTLFVFGLIVRLVLFLFSYIRPIKGDLFYDALEPETEHIAVQDCQLFIGRSRFESIEEIVGDCCVKDSWLNQYLYSDHYNYTTSALIIYDVNMSESMEVHPDQHKRTTSSSPSTFVDQSVDDDDDLESSDETEDSVISPDSSASDPLMLENMLQDDSVSPISSLDSNDSSSAGVVLDDAEDPFHNKYTSRVRFFDVLYHERLHGISAILNEHLSNPHVLDCIEPSANYPMVWSRMARKRVLRSLENDLEMINVAQSCLFWEALDHQYHKVEALSLSDHCGNILFHHNISGKFQELQILLERFVENQRCESQKPSSVASKRLSLQGLLHVPDATGFVLMEMMSEDNCIRPTQLLEAIDKCIQAFWLYIKTDDRKKPFWKNEGIWRTHPPVEDPQDLELLYNVLKDLHKKGIMLRGVQGKSKCWIRRKVKPMQAEHEKRNIVVAMIDMKLVQRMLKMSLISRSHLKWCQDKLNNLDFKQDNVFRARNSHLFPSP
ncbi:uncharacterized protein LOC130988765 [Salvia miltiorrhiza]|uniref:uncharacterized protein LOC130988765 n=1 Tax=Salvia miltiorrhiza TaxID=226208 RepID=UPI0025AD0DC5|nr:uncharacterized protein LOC130988765 [Salvia miltiorrhiza]